MRTHLMNIVVLAAVLAFSKQQGLAQSSFVNLSLENPILPLIPDSNFTVPIANALPGWMGYIGGIQVDRIVYNTMALDAAAISIHDSGSDSFEPLLGSYSVFLQGSSVAAPSASAAIGQTGQIPQEANSLRFLASPTASLEVMFAGQSIPLVEISATATYRILGGDISAFAGQSGELRFTALPQHGGLLDSIFFSPQPIPEPSVFGLFAATALLLGLRRFRCSTRPR